MDGLLGAIGLDEGQESAYRALVALGAAEVPDLAHRLTLPVPQTERALRHLERHGLAAQSSARPGRWVAAPPGVALGALLTQQRHELEQAELAAALLAEEYRAEAAEPHGARPGGGGDGGERGGAPLPPAPARRGGGGVRAGHRPSPRW